MSFFNKAQRKQKLLIVFLLPLEARVLGVMGLQELQGQLRLFGKTITKCIISHSYNYASVVWKVVWESRWFVVNADGRGLSDLRQSPVRAISVRHRKRAGPLHGDAVLLLRPSLRRAPWTQMVGFRRRQAFDQAFRLPKGLRFRRSGIRHAEDEELRPRIPDHQRGQPFLDTLPRESPCCFPSKARNRKDVFPTMGYSEIRRIAIKHSKKAGLPHIKIHGFRHSCVSFLLSQGMNYRTVAR